MFERFLFSGGQRFPSRIVEHRFNKMNPSGATSSMSFPGSVRSQFDSGLGGTGPTGRFNPNSGADMMAANFATNYDVMAMPEETTGGRRYDSFDGDYSYDSGTGSNPVFRSPAEPEAQKHCVRILKAPTSLRQSDIENVRVGNFVLLRYCISFIRAHRKYSQFVLYRTRLYRNSHISDREFQSRAETAHSMFCTVWYSDVPDFFKPDSKSLSQLQSGIRAIDCNT